MKHFERFFPLSIIAFLVLLGAFPSAAERSPASVTNALNENWEWKPPASGVAIHFMAFSPANPFGFKISAAVSEGTAVFCNNSVYMEIRKEYEEPPVYEPKTEGNLGEFDDKGNLVVWRLKEVYLWYSPSRNEALKMFQASHVNAKSEVVAEYEYYLLHRYPLGQLFRQPEFRDFWIALGRGIGKVEQISNITTAPSGLLTALASAAIGETTAREWNVTLDVEGGFLVRTASLTNLMTGVPLLEIINSGNLRLGDFSIAETGEIIYSLAPDQFKRETYRTYKISEAHAGDSTVERIKLRMSSPLPEGSGLLDYEAGGLPVKKDWSGPLGQSK